MGDFLVGLILGVLVTFLIGVALAWQTETLWEKQAIQRGHATYRLVNSNETTVIFMWNTNTCNNK